MTDTATQHFIIIANCVLNLALAFVAISGNALVLYGVWKTPALRSPSILLVCGLASTDLCVGLISQPLFIARWFVGLYSRSENPASVLKGAYLTVGACLCAASLLMIAGINIDRLIAIVKPLQYPSIVTSSRVTRILVAIWVVCALVVSIRIWEERVLFTLIFSSAFICLSISTICHAIMYKIMRRHRLEIHSQIQAFEDRNVRTSIITLRKSTFNAFVVFVALVICYCPYLVVGCIFHFSGNADDLTLGWLLSSTVVFLNSALNPLLYCWRIREIRHVVLQKFQRLVSRE